MAHHSSFSSIGRQVAEELETIAGETIREFQQSFSPLDIIKNAVTGDMELAKNTTPNATPLDFDTYKPPQEHDALSAVRSQLAGMGTDGGAQFQRVKSEEREAIQFFQERDSQRQQQFEEERLQSEHEQTAAHYTPLEEPQGKQPGQLGVARKKATVPTTENKISNTKKG